MDNYIRNWRIEASDDGRTWNTIATFVNNAILTGTNHFIIAIFQLTIKLDDVDGFVTIVVQ
jgi:hypothetical protein